ncbi:MAG TPA: DinB family protein [Flavitalea sp.]|nr:DinB family protein [Flavitalea sp.]
MGSDSFVLEEAIALLSRTPAILIAWLKGLNLSWVHHNEGGETWNAYDILGHLVHGEKTDWIPRMKIILREGDKKFEPFDRFAQFKDSKGKSIEMLLAEFSTLREQNILLLTESNLSNRDLLKTGIHPTFGEVTLKQLLAAWVAHDCTHLYQLSRVMAHRYLQEVGPWKEFMGVLKNTEK